MNSIVWHSILYVGDEMRCVGAGGGDRGSVSIDRSTDQSILYFIMSLGVRQTRWTDPGNQRFRCEYTRDKAE